MVAVQAHALPDGRLLIGDEWITATTGGTVGHRYPGTGAVQAQVALAGIEEVDAAVAAAKAASPAWRALPGAQRGDIMRKMQQLFLEHAEELTWMSTREAGLPKTMASWAPQFPAMWFGYYAGWADKIEGRTMPTFPVEGFGYTIPEPYGVVGIITTWNGPLALLGMKVAPALAAGNCVVLKPSELTPFTSLRVAELALEAGLPPGVLNVIPGGGLAGDRLVRHPDVGKVSFTGGPATARKIISASQDTMKPLTLELGGKSANLVFADADLDTAIPFAVNFSIVINSGQGCGLGTRLLVEDSVYDEVIERVVAELKGLPVGDPSDESTVIGPLINEDACVRISGLLADAEEQGSGRLVTGGSRVGGKLAEGYYMEPTVLADVPVDSTIAQEEIFGPVLCVMKFSGEADAVRIANSTRYGLAALIQSRDLSRTHRVASNLAAGNIWVNGFYNMAPGIPFGGYRESGYGREGGKEGLDEYLQTKSVVIHYPSAEA